MERVQRRVEEARSGLQAWLGQLEGLTIIKARGRLAGREGEQFVVLAGEASAGGAQGGAEHRHTSLCSAGAWAGRAAVPGQRTAVGAA